MNQDPPPPFDTVGDEPVEARIVAWVLGEASAFEAAELERLCGERPELLVFHRRMLALHGLLKESEASEGDRSWKLPPAKRQLLDGPFGKEKVVLLDPRKESRIRHSGRRAILAIAACLVLTVIVGSLMMPAAMRRKMGIDIAGGSTWHEAEDLHFVGPSGGAGMAADEDQLNVKDSFQGIGSFDTAINRNRTDATLNNPNRVPPASTAPRKPAAEAHAVAEWASRVEGSYAVQSPARDIAGMKEAKQRSRMATGVSPEQPVAGSAAGFASNLPDSEPLESLSQGGAGGLAGGMGDRERLAAAMANQPLGMMMPSSEPAPSADSRQKSEKPAMAAVSPAEPPAAGPSASRGGRPQVQKELGAIADAADGFSAVSPAANGKPAGVVNGLRSGDSAISRNNIDAILSNPNRLADRPEDAKNRASGEREDVAKTKQSFSDAAPPPVLATKKPMSTASPQQLAKSGTSSLMGRDGPADGGDVAGESFFRMNNRQYAGTDLAMDEVQKAIRENPALMDEDTRNANTVRRGLYTAEGDFNLGRFDEAKREYENVLKADPFNAAARRGMEQVAGAKSDYHRAAYDQTRAELLSQVDMAWKLPVSEEAKAGKDSKPADMPQLPKLRSDPDTQTYSQQTDAVAAMSKSLNVESDKKEIEVIRESEDKGLDELRPAPVPPIVHPVDLMEEIAAAENPYSTFSLNISDASFQIARAALAKGEQPDPTAIKVEQFYNAVDYDDPAPAANEPVAATIEQSSHPLIPGRNLVRVALRTASSGRSAAQPLRLTLLVDQSGSMIREDRRASMEQAVKQLGGLLTANDKITVIGFSRTPRLLADGLGGDQGATLGELINQTASEGGTNLEEAMKLGAQMAERHLLAGAQNRIVLFTDGAANLGNANPEKLAEQVKTLRQNGIAFDIAGIGADGLNDRLLGELVRHGNGRYYVVSDAKDDSFARQLAGAFRPAAENVKVQVNFNPQRVGRYKLIGFEKDRLKTEDFRNDAVDAAELAADEAGVAIYQVEPLGDGTGELGEVSVRFRDTASGEMVERGWTIPYQPAAPAFDRATPSMQLAGLAMFAAEKLKGGPLAEAIDFKKLAAPEADVKQFYHGSPRVVDMLRVIDALR